ncbi:MAG: magnetochrome domain-containing protein [Magnetococcales bacterium]|nr:magnetochrome domain-containing protein [Magnetococcales bacterium]
MGALLLLAVVGLGLFANSQSGGKLLKKWVPEKLNRPMQGEIFGSMPAPTEPSIKEPMVDMVAPKKTRKMVVRRIPVIKPGQKMPHGYWGPCTKCHLFTGGAPPGSQPITPVGKMWEKASSIKKVGPPILPDSTRHHPPSGRCIKCHDIVVEVPI